MKKIKYILALLIMFCVFTSCGGDDKQENICQAIQGDFEEVL